MNAGGTIRAMRAAMGLSLRELGRRAGTTPGYLSQVERGKRDPSERWLGAVKRALGEHMIERTA